MNNILKNIQYFIRRTGFLITWISIVIYVFYQTFIYYQNGIQFQRIRNILGMGLYISRGTATVLNISSALVLLPLCKKMNRILYCLLSKVWPGLFFFWLENSKSFHITVAITLVVFAVIHSISHFVNFWNFSKHYDSSVIEVNFAQYKNENPLLLMLSQPGLTGVSMLFITLSMSMTSMRTVRRQHYNTFWYAHQCYMPYLVLLLIHPLSGVLKEEILENNSSLDLSYLNATNIPPQFIAIKSKTWAWMAFPLSCFLADLLWRFSTRYKNRLQILEVTHMAGGTVRLVLNCPKDFKCRIGQYVLLQCPDISVIEWHPFTVVELPTASQRHFTVWIRVTGDWTEALQRLLLERGPNALRMLSDGPFCSAMEPVVSSNISFCVAAGVGITPFVALLRHMLMFPRSTLPVRVHLMWIVRHESEISWLAELANQTMIELRNNNKPDRLHLELYVSDSHRNVNNKEFDKDLKQLIVIKGKENTHNVVLNNVSQDQEKVTLLTPQMKRFRGRVNNVIDSGYTISERYPLLACRIRRGRPHWDRVFGYWVHLYPGYNLNLYCCGPKKLVKLLRIKSKETSQMTKTTLNFVHEGFS